MGTPTFQGLLDLLWKHPEFNSLESNECDNEIITYGKKLWEQWNIEEKEALMQHRRANPRTEVSPLVTCKADIDKLNMHPKRKEALLMLLDDLPYREIEAKTGVKVSALQEMRCRFKLPTKTLTNRVSQEELLALLREHKTFEAVGKVLGFKGPRISLLAKRYGLKKEQWNEVKPVNARG